MCGGAAGGTSAVPGLGHHGALARATHRLRPPPPPSLSPAAPLAGRTRFVAYVTTALCMAAFIYPVACHWVISRNGLFSLSTTTPIDFVGAGPIHVLGGAMGLMGSWLVGPRINFDGRRVKDRFAGAHNKLLAASGAFLLWTGWCVAALPPCRVLPCRVAHPLPAAARASRYRASSLHQPARHPSLLLPPPRSRP